MSSACPAPYPASFRAFATLGALGAAAWLLSPVFDLLLMAFAGLLLALFLSGVGAYLARLTGWSHRVATAVLLVALVLLAEVAAALIAPELIRQLIEVAKAIPHAVDVVMDSLRQGRFGQQLHGRLVEFGTSLSVRDALARATGLLSSGVGALASFVAFLFIGLFVAFDAPTYQRGALKLFPKRVRPRIDEVMQATARSLRYWMLGQFFSMSVVGVLTGIGLLIIGIPLAFGLACLSALLTFIPNFGPIASALLAALIAATDEPMKAAYVIGLYLAVQTVESYLLTPLIQRKTVSLPPALTIVTQLALGVLAGGIGLVVATPLTVAALALIQRLYVEDTLGDAPADDARASPP